MESAPLDAHKRRIVFAGVIGNILEWYDFALFGYFAHTISDLYFPAESRLASLLQVFAIFAVGYLMRPIGGIIFGHIGDRVGRKRALELSVALMAIPTALTGLLPPYALIGAAAPVLLTVIRVLQGLSVGGEYIGSIAFLGEHAPPSRRGFIGSFCNTSAGGGILLGSAVATLMTLILPTEQLDSWGWRVPFLAGILVGVVGWWLRRGVEESPHFVEVTEGGAVARLPIREAVRHGSKAIATTFGLTLLVAVGFYMPFVWMPTFLADINTPALPDALAVNTVTLAIGLLLMPWFGHLSDRIGRPPVILAGALGYMLLTYPVFVLLEHGTLLAALAGQAIFAVLMAAVNGPMAAAFVEMFPTRTRYTGIAIGYNAGQALFGGTAPVVATWLIAETGTKLAPALYLTVIAALSTVATLAIPIRFHENLE